MKKYIQLQDTYRTKKGAIWVNYTQKTDIFLCKDNQLLEKEETLINNPDWFAPYEEKKEYSKTWEDLKEISGYYVGSASSVRSNAYSITVPDSRNIYAKKNQAIAALAEAQLSQLLQEIYEGEGWKPRWEDDEQEKYCIVKYLGSLYVNLIYDYTQFITLPTAELAEQFLENHRELIETYFKKFEW